MVGVDMLFPFEIECGHDEIPLDPLVSTRSHVDDLSGLNFS